MASIKISGRGFWIHLLLNDADDYAILDAILNKIKKDIESLKMKNPAHEAGFFKFCCTGVV